MQTPATAARPRCRCTWSGYREATAARPCPRRDPISSPPWDLFFVVVIQPPVNTNHDGRVHLRAGGVAVDEQAALATISVQLLYHWRLIQCVWQSIFKATFLSNLHGNRSKSLQQYCSAINQLHLCYLVLSQKGSRSCMNLVLKLLSVHCQFEFSDLNSLIAIVWAGLSPSFSQEHGLHSSAKLFSFDWSINLVWWPRAKIPYFKSYKAPKLSP
jgi:hypothetical protein